MVTLPAAASTVIVSDPVHSSEEPASDVFELVPESSPEAFSSSPSESTDLGYFLRSGKKPTTGLGKVSPPVRRGRGRKTNISKAQSRAKVDMREGKQQTIEKALRAEKARNKGR